MTAAVVDSGGLTVTLGGITVTGNSTITGTMGGITTLTAATLGGTLSTASQPNVTTMAGLTAASALATVGTITSGTWNGSVVTTTYGGTGLASYTTGDLLYFNSGTAFNKLGIGAANTVAVSTGSAPSWSTSLNLAGAVTAGGLLTASASLAVTGGLTYTTTVTSTTNAATPGTFTGTQSTSFASTTLGNAQMGYGSTYDVSLLDRAGTVALGIGPNSTAVTIPGLINGQTISATANFTGSVSMGALTATTGTFSDPAGVNDLLTVGNSTTGDSARVRMLAGSGHLAWMIGAQYNVSGSLEFTPSTVAGGTTFSTPVLMLSNTDARAAVNLIFSTDNTYDIGASGATRPRNIYVAGTGNFGGAVTVSATTASVQVTSTTTTNAAYFEATTNGAGYFFGVDNSTATVFGANVYSMVMVAAPGRDIWLIPSNTASKSVVIATTGAVQMKTYGAGAATFDASGNITSVSDERHKTDIRPFTRGLSDLLGLKPITYKFNQLSGLEMAHDYSGFSAQNVQAFIPEAVMVGSDGILSFSDRPVLAACVNAIQSLDDRLSRLEQRAA
jgi:hypothetical protein